MNIIGWIILGTYLLGYLPWAVVIARACEASNPATDTEERIMNAVMGFVFGMFWPLVIPVGWIYRKVYKNVPDNR